MKNLEHNERENRWQWVWSGEAAYHFIRLRKLT